MLVGKNLNNIRSYMQKKILINLSFSIWPMLGFELDLIQQKLDEGHLVKVLYCNGSAEYCIANNSNSLSNKKIGIVCEYCKSRFNKGIKWLKKSNNLIIEHFELLYVSHIDKINEYDNLLQKKNQADDEVLKFLKNIHFSMENIIKTTMIAEFNSVKFNHKEKKYFNYFKKISKQTIISYFSSLNHFEKFHPDEVYIFNGRLSRYQPMLRMAQSKLKDENIYTYEFPIFEFQNMMIIKKNYPHDLKNLSNELLQFGKNENTEFSEKEAIVKNWIQSRERGDNYKYDFYNWKNNTQPKFLPEEFNDLNFNISYFTSTETEFLGIPENEKDFAFANNLEIIETILKKIKNKSKIFLTIRFHPNFNNDSMIDLNQLKKLKNQYSNMFIVGPTSKTDSYSLIKNSNLVIVASSTIGIEAAFYKKNVISTSNSPYTNFGATKQIASSKELNFLLDKCIINNFEDFPSDADKYKNAVHFIYTYINFYYKSKYLVKKNYTEETMIRNDKIYKLEPDKTIKYLYKFYCLIRVIFKKIKIYI